MMECDFMNEYSKWKVEMCVLIDTETRTKERKGGSYRYLSLLGSTPLFHAFTITRCPKMRRTLIQPSSEGKNCGVRACSSGGCLQPPSVQGYWSLAVASMILDDGSGAPRGMLPFRKIPPPASGSSRMRPFQRSVEISQK